MAAMRILQRTNPLISLLYILADAIATVCTGYKSEQKNSPDGWIWAVIDLLNGTFVPVPSLQSFSHLALVCLNARLVEWIYSEKEYRYRTLYLKPVQQFAY